jgi:hypothetical protein
LKNFSHTDSHTPRPKELNDYLKDQTAFGRVGLCDDMGGAVAALLDDESEWTGGQHIELSGGMYL